MKTNIQTVNTEEAHWHFDCCLRVIRLDTTMYSNKKPNYKAIFIQQLSDWDR